VLALQGDFREHIRALQRLGIDAVEVRLPADLAGVDGLLLQELAKPNQARSKRGIEALIRATQIYARSLAPERALNSR
jgi:hypothetical protein